MFPLGISDLQPFPGFQDGGEFEVDDAEASLSWIVGDIPVRLIIVPDSELFQGAEQFLDLLAAESPRTASTVTSDKVEFVSIRVENSWNKRTPPLLQEFKNSAFVLEAFPGERPTEPLVDPPIKSHSDQSDLGIFDLTFLTIAWVIHSEVGQLL